MDKIQRAINEWNKKNNPYCVFIKNDQAKDAVKFKRNDTKGPHAIVGYYPGKNFISLPIKYPNGPELQMVCILHEMMHCVGFQHEHSRKDRDKHVNVFNIKDNNYKIEGVPLGQYDYNSIMHYCEIKH